MPDTSSVSNQQAIMASLKSEFFRLGRLGVAGLVATSIILSLIWRWSGALQWAAQAVLIWVFVCYQTKRRLHLNRPEPDAPLYKDLGLANRLTLLRSWLIAAVAGFVFQPWPEGPALAWLPGMIYFFAAILDRIDGFAARRTGQSSLLGTELDTVSDALGLAVAALLAFGYGQVHWSYLLVGITYYLFHAGMLWRKSRELPVYPLPPAFHRRAWAGFQMGFLVVALWPLFFPPITKLAGFAFMTPVLLGFFIDWLFVSGRIDQPADGVNRSLQKLGVLSYHVLQPSLRILIVIMLIVSVLQSGLPLLSGNSSTWLNKIMFGGFAFTSLMVLLGIAGRYFSLLLMCLLAWYYITKPLLPVDYLLFCCVIWLLLLGTGRFSLWQGDDHWLNGYDGA
jgi:CDP-diacylglycerol--glycerol-3-phosphate 3-phosphatidyltransferase